MDKKKIEEFATTARKQLIENLTYEASRIGITPTKIQDPITEAEDIQTFTISGITNTLYGKQIEQRNQLIEEIQTHTFDEVIEKIAYTWFNRIIAIRFMEINNYLPTHTRVLSSITPEKKEPDIITEALNLDLDYTEEEIQQIYKYKTENNVDGLYKLLFIKQCNKLNEILPELFETIDDYTEILFNIQLSNENNIINKLITTIPEEDFTNQVEIIGWMYQYYNNELKDEIININNSVINKEEIPAATQLFTTDWIVKYMVENSVGKYYIEHNPKSTLKNEFKYLIKDNLEKKDEKINVEKLKFIDPCMGSGHILSYAFDIFMKIYEDLGYYKKEIPKLILEKNLFGADIDERAYQLTYFSLLLKARRYDRSIFKKDIKLNILSYEDSNISEDLLNKMKTNGNKLYEDIIYLNDCFKNSREFGSLIQINNDINIDEIEKKINIFNNRLSNSITDLTIKTKIKNQIRPLINETKLLVNKYDFVVTNPPYMNKLSKNYKEFAKKHYKEYSKDLFSMFIYRNSLLTKNNGYSAFMTPFVWMFIKNYQKLRQYIINNLSISSLIQLEYSAFKEATVPICTFILLKNKNIKGTFIKLSDFKGGMNTQKIKYFESINNDVNYKFLTDLNIFKSIPNNPISYWINDNFLKIFKEELKLSDISDIKVGLQTGDNDKFLRLWYEVDKSNIEFGCKSLNESEISDKYWYPYNKGGFFRKWYGNQEYVVYWYKNGYSIRNFKDSKGKLKSVIRNPKYYFKPSISWSKVSSGKNSFRFYPNNFIFDVIGCSIFNKDNFYYLLGLLNSNISDYILNLISPSLGKQIGDFSNIPVILDSNPDIIRIVQKNIKMVKEDWDEQETSWDFIKHPLMKKNNSLKDNFDIYKNYKEKMFKLLKSNEIKLNKIFSDIYNEKTICLDVDEKYVSIKKADYKQDIQSFISYVVGCIFGRYSLDEDGLVYSGGVFNLDNYTKFIPDDDNIIPVIDEEYFDDDIINHFIKFIDIAFGNENLNENLDFIANALNKKGKSSRDIINNYFINDFADNHISMYSMPRRKSPIYWMFDSGKENAFKCLIYMHRYEPDLVSKIRFEYLHKTQSAIEDNIKLQESIINESENKSKVNKANKKKTKLIKQLDEIKLYDLALAHVANQRIEIDLDEGVKVNYAKFQNIEVVDPKTNKTRKINLLKKI